MFFYTFLPKIFNMSLTACVAIVLIILLRLLLKKAPKVFSYALWGVVLFRLLCPVSVGATFSLYNLFDAPTEETGTITSVIEYVPSNIVHTKYPSVALPMPGINDVINEMLPQGEEQLRADPLEGPIFIATYIWMAGVSAMIVYSAVSHLQLSRKLSVFVPLRDNIFIVDGLKSPFVVGLFRPKIYLPCNLDEKEQEYIILHEQHHIRRFDHIIKALAFMALTIHWFNPLVWVAFVLASKDMEMSCDEAVIRALGRDVRADYSASLLTLATGRRIIAGTPLAFGEGDPKGRIKNLAKWRKPAVWVIIIAALLCVVIAVTLLTNPVNHEDDEAGITWYFGTVQDAAMGKVHESDHEARSYVTLLCEDGNARLFWLTDGCKMPTESIWGEYVMVRATTELSTGLPVVTSIQFTESDFQDTLEAAIRTSILEHHAGKYYPAECQTAHFKLLAQNRDDYKEGDQVTCYGIVLYHEYNLTDGVLIGAAGALVPTVLTFQVTESQGLRLAEYWEPRDGSYYADDIKAKFRGEPWPDTTKYPAEQELNCYLQAASYFGVGTDTVVHSILTDIEGHSRWVESFAGLMENCEHERGMLAALGSDTIRYCFARFQEGGHDDLYGQIMAYVCSEILDARGVKPVENWSFQQSGQDWFGAFTRQNPEWLALIPSEAEN